MADFPALKPSARSFQLGQYPIKVYRAMSGATVRRSFGSRPYGYTLDLEFRNVPDATVDLIIDHYNGQGGGTIGFNVPGVVFVGYSTTVISKVGTPAGIEWLYAEPPSVTSVIRDISNITVRLVGELVT
jgi:hypothetical protein